MGEVYLAEDTELHRRVAIRFLAAQYTTDEGFKARFKRKAQAAGLNHPNIITIMEYVEGSSLGNIVTHERISE